MARLDDYCDAFRTGHSLHGIRDFLRQTLLDLEATSVKINNARNLGKAQHLGGAACRLNHLAGGLHESP